MNGRRLWFAAVLIALLGCHEDPPITLVYAPPLVSGITALGSGGSASTAGLLSAVGGLGGSITVFAQTSILLGSSTVTPLPPSAPILPTVGTLVDTASFAGGSDIDVPLGNLLIEGAVTTDVAGLPGTPRTIQADLGDIVVSGTLQSGKITMLAPSGATIRVLADLKLAAPNGTIYVAGVINTGSVDGFPDGDSAGSLTLIARRIVILGTLATRGESNSFGPQGGAGGNVTLQIPASGDGILLRAGAIVTGGAPGTTLGGHGGDIQITALGGSLDLFGTIDASGASVGSGQASVLGGNGGSITVTAGGPSAINSTISSLGGAAGTSSMDAAGGNGGPFSLLNAVPTAPVPVQMYGRIDLRGGPASASDSITGVLGGQGGALSLGQFSSPLQFIQSGSSILDSSGGAGDSGGTGGAVTLGILGTGSADLTFSGSVNSLGGAGSGGPGGSGGPVALSTLATGRILLSGSFNCGGGPSSADQGGDSGGFSVTTGPQGPVVITSSAQILASGGAGGSAGAGGLAGGINVGVTGGSVELTGLLEANGGSSPLQFTLSGSAGPAPGGSIQIQTGTGTGSGSLLNRASILALGGSSSAVATTVAGAPGGSVLLLTQSASGLLTLGTTSFIQVDGGTATGSGNGGTGGSIQAVTSTPSVSISGILDARGGSATGPAARGGMGGRFLSTTDASNLGTPLGSITINGDALIDVSGGAGFFGGSARGDGMSYSVTNPVAVALSAESVPGKTNSGAVVNLGTIVAAAGSPSGSGGDVGFLGTGSISSAPPVAGNLILSGSGSGRAGDFAGVR